MYSLMYENRSDYDIFNIINTINIYNIPDNIIIKNIDLLLGRNYWEDEDNCNIKLTELFFSQEKNSDSSRMLETLLLNTTNDSLIYYLMCNIICSKNYCHVVVNNEKILKKLSPIIEKYKLLMKYLWGYAWISLYIDEVIMGENIKTTDRVVFTLDTANLLTEFPICGDDVKQNPYATLFLDDNLKYNNKLFLMPVEGEYNGIVNLSEFKRRVNIFATGENIDPFENLNWQDIALSGSIMPACLLKKSHLMDLLVNQDLNTFYKTFYANSDINIIIKSIKFTDYIDKLIYILRVVKKNMNSEANISTCRNITVYVTQEFINDKSYFYAVYMDAKKKYNEKIKNHIDKYKDDINVDLIYNFADECDITIKIVPNIQNNSNALCIKSSTKDQSKIIFAIYEGIQFKVSVRGMRTMGISNINGDFISSVSQFHMPCVRSYYDGSMVYLLPSCITALMTTINVDFKCFTKSNDYIDVIYKYICRGFGIPLNKKDIYLIRKQYLFKNGSIKDLFSPKCSSDKFILKFMTHFNEKPVIKQYKYIKDCNDLKKLYNINKDCIDLFKIKTIQPKGSINPLNKWLIEAFIKN